MNSQSIKIAVFLLIMALTSNTYAGGESELPAEYFAYYESLPFRLEQLKTDTPTEEALLLLSEAETVVRIIVILGISEEGGHDFLIGKFIDRLIEMNRWDVIYSILENHSLYPQSSYWIIVTLLYNKEYRNAEIKETYQEYNKELGHMNAVFEDLAKKLKEHQDQKSNK